MKVTVNGQDVNVSVHTLANLMLEMNLPQQGVAIAVDGEIVPKGLWTTFELHEASKIEIVTAAAGG